MSVNQDELADSLATVLGAIEASPNNVALLQKQVELMRALDMTDELEDTVAHLSSLVMLDEAQWKTRLDETIVAPLSLDAVLKILERFDQAEQDYHSIDILQRHAKFLVHCTSSEQGEFEADVTAALDTSTVRDMLSLLNSRCAGDLEGSSRVWGIWRDWEMSRLGDETERAAQIERLHELYLGRLATSHLDYETTSSEYSSFCTEHSSQDYEARMVAATSTLQSAKAKFAEKRHGRTRQDFEEQLSYAQEAISRVPILVSYMTWETDPQAKSGGSRGPIVDPLLTQNVFERTLAAYSIMSTEASETDRQGVKDGEATIWERYVNWARMYGGDESTLVVAKRAVRACPQSSRAWCALLIEMERQKIPAPALTAAFDRALELGPLLTTAQSGSIAEFFVARSAQQARLADDVSEGVPHPVIETIKRGLEEVVKIEKDGEPSLKMEKFLLEWAETKRPARVDEALEILKKPLRVQSCSYQIVLQRASLEIRRGQLDAARQLYAAAIQRSDLDWPEAVFEAFTRFEIVHGSVETIIQTARKLDKETEKLARRREKAAKEQASYYTASEAPNVPEPVAEAVVETVAEDMTSSATTKDESRVKRDREHTTVLVGGLPKGTSQGLLESFFESCGDIREATISAQDDWPNDIALIEFRAVESVSAALAKDRRKFDGHEITVTMLWRSTLFVTNFPREMDQKAVKSLFQNYGTVLDDRWPSRKYADSRRFCYITMGNPTAAESALALDGFRSDPNARFGLTVRISDPTAKVKRTDEGNAVLFVGGLTSKTTEQDVRTLIEAKGVVSSLKLGWDPVKAICKGFAFVTMASEADAKEALTLHGTSYQGRKLKIERSDPNFANKKQESDATVKDKRARTVRLVEIPDGMQEGLLQQALEKIVPVRRLELFAKTHHAQAELESQADVGRLLLRKEAFEVDGAIIKIVDPNTRQVETPVVAADKQEHSDKATTKVTSALAFAPRAAKKGGTLGRGRHGPPAKAPSTPVVGGATQDAFRAVVEAKNKQREGNLETNRGKRPLEQDADQESKKAKVE